MAFVTMIFAYMVIAGIIALVIAGTISTKNKIHPAIKPNFFGFSPRTLALCRRINDTIKTISPIVLTVELLIVIVGMRIKKCKEIVIMISLAIILCSILMKFAQLKYQEKMS